MYRYPVATAMSAVAWLCEKFYLKKACSDAEGRSRSFHCSARNAQTDTVRLGNNQSTVGYLRHHNRRYFLFIYFQIASVKTP